MGEEAKLITGTNWAVAAEDGWRLVRNLTGDLEQDCLAVAALLREHGCANIAIGADFGVLSPATGDDLRGFAVYARDAQEFLSELEEDLVNIECGHSMV